jgi:hypothetical protein
MRKKHRVQEFCTLREKVKKLLAERKEIAPDISISASGSTAMSRLTCVMYANQKAWGCHRTKKLDRVK